jgi:lambda family phage minor tail protein L
MTITADIQQLSVGSLIELFELDATNIGGDVLRFHGHLQNPSIYWQGNEYKAWPIQATGFKRTADASQPTPSLSVADINGTISSLCLATDDLVGATVRRRRTLKKYLDAANFTDGNATADPTAELPLEIWRVEQKSQEITGNSISFTLASPLDFGGQQIPARQIVGACQWAYKGADCGWNGTTYFDAKDNAVDDPSLDRCGYRLSSCEARFGTDNPLPWGGFLSDVIS